MTPTDRIRQTGEHLLADVIHHPEDDGVRLIYADWLEEHGQEERGEFIRIQCELARLAAELATPYPDQDLCTDESANWCPNCGDCRCPCPEDRKDHPACPLHGPASRHANDDSLKIRQGELRQRERELLAGRGWAWAGKAVRGAFALGTDCNDVLTFRRGFVEQITLPLAAWIGRECERCDGWGRLRHPDMWDDEPDVGCPVCHGSGRFQARGIDLVRAAPLTAVRLSDRRPGNCCWSEEGYGYADEVLPAPIFSLLDDYCDISGLGSLKVYPTEDAALDAVSVVLLTLARQWAGRTAPC